jgi:hypothetical protein
MKLPMLLVDLAIGWLLWKMATKERRETTLLIWLLNPITIYAIYGTGQFDIFPTFLVVLGVYCWSKKMEWLTYALMGLAGGLKLFPLLLIPLLLFLDKRRFVLKVLGVISAVVAFGLSFFPANFSMVVIKGIFGTNLADSMFKAGIDLGSGAFLPVSLLAYAGMLIYILIAKNKPTLSEAILVTLILILGLTRFHPQWIIWIAPFVVLLIVEGKISNKIGVWLSVAYFGTMMLIADKFTNFGQLKAISNAFDTLLPVRSYLDKTGVGLQLYGLFLAAFLAGGLALTNNLFSRKNDEENWGKILVNKLPLIVGTWITSLVILFAIVHVPLTMFGKYLDFETTNQNVVAPLTAKTKMTQEIKVKNNNLSTIQVLIKNINLRTHTNLIWKLYGSDKAVVVEGVVNGGSVGDDFDLTIQFPKIKDSAGKTYVLEFSDPGTVVDEEFVFPYDAKAINGFSINGKPIGTLAYRTFFNPGGYIENVKYSLMNILRRI